MSDKCSTKPIVQRYKRHRFPAEVIAHAVWLDFRFPLSLLDVEDLLAERGIEVSFQTVSEWAAKFGREFARHIRSRSKSNFADKWHLDEMLGLCRKPHGNIDWGMTALPFQGVRRCSVADISIDQ